MNITKYGHCCLLIEIDELRILTDPGSYTVDKSQEAQNIDLILITHEHGDHLHIPSIQGVLAKNPNAHIVTNQSVLNILEKEGIGKGISFNVSHGQSMNIKGILIEGFGTLHAEIY